MTAPGTGRRSTRWAAAAVLAAVVGGWMIAHVAAGTNAAGESMVPGIADIYHATKGFASEWPGGWGIGRTDEGTEPTWTAALLAIGYHSAITGARMLSGFVAGALAGIVLAAAVSWSRRVRQVVYVPAHISRMLPLLGLVPLFGLWFGNSATGVVVFVAFTVFVQVFAFGINAVAAVPEYYEHAARSLGAGRIRTYVAVVLPAATPALGAGLSISLALGWSAAISAEFNGQVDGLGQVAYMAQYFTRTSTLAVVAIVVGVLSAGSFVAARAGVAWLTRWSE
ncbi:ABC transporter permease [Nocardia sp. NPDC058379]|uniref:ABC transporter permease n=1 Tax=unclassified Nocardia TaxID=2637762 RepID=UPI00366910E3